MARLGIISDTHGLVRPEALVFLRGCEHIVHGGDIGSAEVLTQLSAVAPVTAVRGNTTKASGLKLFPRPSCSSSMVRTSTQSTTSRSST